MRSQIKLLFGNFDMMIGNHNKNILTKTFKTNLALVMRHEIQNLQKI